MYFIDVDDDDDGDDGDIKLKHNIAGTCDDYEDDDLACDCVDGIRLADLNAPLLLNLHGLYFPLRVLIAGVYLDDEDSQVLNLG